MPESAVSRIQPPEEFGCLWVQEVAVEGEPVYHLRFEPSGSEGPSLCGEHYSALVTPDGTLKGETLMDARLSEEYSRAELPAEDEARETALRYLEEKAPDLAESVEFHWVAPHPEKVLLTSDEVTGGLAVTVTGMKVKCRNKTDGRWFWVIVGPENRVITFERDVVWNSEGSMRQTEMWLHDLWLANKNG